MIAQEPFLSVRNLSVAFGPDGVFPAVQNLSLDLNKGRTLCLIGESGSGKSVTSMAIMGLYPNGAAHINADRLSLRGRDLLSLSPGERSALRGRDMSMIFQDPMSSLNPVLNIGYQISEALLLHEKVSARAARARAKEMLRLVRIPDAERRLAAYPHQLSGGMRQRVMIAMALICRPQVLIADEPTTSLDVTVQAQILWLLRDLQRESGTAILFITHDLGVVAEIAHDVSVMYAGHVMETGPVDAVFDKPAHGYTVGLLGAAPDYRTRQAATAGRLTEIPGMLSPSDRTAAGCSFAPRCTFAVDSCRARKPDYLDYGERHRAACDQVQLAANAVGEQKVL